MKNTVGSFIGIVLNLEMTWGSILIFNILILSIHEHGIFVHLFVSFDSQFVWNPNNSNTIATKRIKYLGINLPKKNHKRPIYRKQ